MSVWFDRWGKSVKENGNMDMGLFILKNREKIRENADVIQNIN